MKEPRTEPLLMAKSILSICIFLFSSIVGLAVHGEQALISHYLDKAIDFSFLKSDSLRIILPVTEALLSDQSSQEDSSRVLLIHALVEKRYGERRQTKLKLEKIYDHARARRDLNLQNDVKLQLAILEREERNFDEALKLLESALAYFKTENDSSNIVRAYSETGQLQFDQGKNTAALHHYILAAGYIDLEKQPLLMADINKSIAASYLRLGELFTHINAAKASVYYKESLRHFNMAFRTFKSDNQLYGSCFCQVGMMQSSLKMDDFATLDSLMQKARDCWEVPDNHILLSLKMIESQLKENAGNLQSASDWLGNILVMKYRFLAPLHYHEAYKQLGVILRKQGEIDSAYMLVQEASEWFVDRKNRLRAYEAYSLLAAWYEADGEITQALNFSKQAAAFKNLLVDEADMEVFDELRYKYETEMLENRLFKAEEKSVLQRKQLQFVLVLLALIAFVMVAVVLFLSMKRKKAILMKQLAEEKAAKTIEESKARKLSLEQVKIEHELEKQKAAANKLLAEKKEQELLLNALRRTESMNLQKDIMARLLPFVTKLSRKTDRDAFESLLNEFRVEPGNDPMGQFESVFKQAYGDFYAKLVETATDLTRAEIQVAVLLRLNLTSKEIAHILSLNTSTVERTRHQLRQKLNLEPSQQLVAWLMGLG